MKTFYVKSPNHSSRYGLKPELIVLHHTATGPNSGRGVANFFRYASSQVSAHEVVDTNGDRYHCVDWDRAAWHAGTSEYKGKTSINSRSLGIEIINKGNGKDPYTRAQISTVARLIRQMSKKYGINLRDIVDHEAINLRGKVDMRDNFPAAKVMWKVVHPYLPYPPSPYKALPKWARRVVDNIKREDGHIF